MVLSGLSSIATTSIILRCGIFKEAQQLYLACSGIKTLKLGVTKQFKANGCPNCNKNTMSYESKKRFNLQVKFILLVAGTKNKRLSERFAVMVSFKQCTQFLLLE